MSDAPLEPRNRNQAYQFSLAQLVLWMAITCCVLSFDLWRIRGSALSSDRVFSLYYNIRLCVFAPLVAACYAGLLLFVWRWIRSRTLPIEAGHLFLAITGVHRLLANAYDVALQGIGLEYMRGMPIWMILAPHIVVTLIGSCLALFAASIQRNGWWRLAFIIMALYAGLQAITTLITIWPGSPLWMTGYEWGIVTRVLTSLPAVCAIIGVIGDRSRKEHHDFMHWAGATVMIVMALVEWPAYLIWLYLFR